MDLKKHRKLSELLEKSEQDFARKVTAMVDESYEKFKPYRDKCWDNERVWRSRHWDDKPFKNIEDASRPRPNVPVLHSNIEKCVADIMDNAPDAIIRGSRADSDVKALIATELVRNAMHRGKYYTEYERKVRAAFKTGTGTLQTYWDPELADGLGDVAYKYTFIDNVVWDHNAADINEGRFLAIISYVSPEDIYDAYPDIDLEECFAKTEEDSEKHPNETEDITNEHKKDGIRVIKFMWREKMPRKVEIDGEDGGKREEELGRTTYINTAVVIGNRVADSKIGQYQYNRYMVGMQPYIEIEGWPVGLSAIDIYRDDADIINMIEQQYVCNLQASAEPRWLVNRTAQINKRQLLNFNEKIVEGNIIHEGAVREFKPAQFSGQALNYKNAKMEEIKEQLGQMSLNNGIRDGDITSGIAVQSMQEYGAKLMRLQSRHFYEGHRDTVKDTLKLMQTHYTTARVIRLSRYAQEEIEKLIAQAEQAIAQVQQAEQEAAQQGVTIPRDMAMQMVLPEGVTMDGNKLTIDFSIFSLEFLDLDYDIQIIPQKKSAATSAMLNNIVAQWAANGSIPADLATELLEFEGKEYIAKRVREYTDMQAQLREAQQMAQQAAEQAQQAAEQAQQLAAENAALQQKVWVEKFKSLRRELLAGTQTDEDEGEEELPATAEEAMAALQDEILGGVQEGAA